jgi:hypothetical protein
MKFSCHSLTFLQLLLLCILSNANTNLAQTLRTTSRLGWIPRGGGGEGREEGNEGHDNTHHHHQEEATDLATNIQQPSTIVDGYELCHETTVYSHWRTVQQRTVRMPTGKMVQYDVVGQKGSGAAIVFSWNTSSRTATILREYNPGPHRILYGLAAGLIEEDKHEGANATIAAQHELEEELHLAGGIWYPLVQFPLAMDKYATTFVHAFLVLDAKPVTNPRPLDEEEDIEIITNVTISEIMKFIRRGDMNVVGSWAALLAIEKLRELGEVDE